MEHQQSGKIAVLTSGGDAPGMNPALRAVVRTALDHGVEVVAVSEGFEGLVAGGDHYQTMSWDSVGGILHRGGTVIGTARSDEFLTQEGRQRASRNLIASNISKLIVIGGDGSMTGAAALASEWAENVAALGERGDISADQAAAHSELDVVGLVGSIDNDMHGTDMTIGADTALHRITEAVDTIGSTATSHQRTFVVEVMGRRCGYLAVMGGIATGADWILIPERPPADDNWEEIMCERLRSGRQAGRRDSIVIVAEGAQDRHGKPITSTYVREALEKGMEEEVRLTILGHMQRGGAPSSFDRTMGTLLGHAAVCEVTSQDTSHLPVVIGMRNNRITTTPLVECVARAGEVTTAVNDRDTERAMALRSPSFSESLSTLMTLLRSLPHPPQPEQRRLRIAVINAGAPAPGMNTATRAAVRLGLDAGHVMFGVHNGIRGLIRGDVDELGWMSVRGWAGAGGSELGTSRKIPNGQECYAIARTIEELKIDALLMIGGWSGYQAMHRIFARRDSYPAFSIPIMCLPASINNNLPGSEMSIGADTALNNIVGVVDKIKQSAVATRRCFVVEVMGRYCGYLALMSGIGTGAERVYLNEEGVTLADMQADLNHLVDGFKQGKRLGLMIRNETANSVYTTPFMAALFEEECGDLFEVRTAILGHLQQGGNPSPFDRIQATRLAKHCIEALIQEAERGTVGARYIGFANGKVETFSLEDLPRMVDTDRQRPREQWWMDLRPIARLLAQPGPSTAERESGEGD
ncbi:MAG: 6-phosphofructokinase [bacterium]|nr:6-phosphofructokinase [bacterium]